MTRLSGSLMMINLIVNGKLCTALLDTRSGATLIKRSIMKRRRLELNESKAWPMLTAVNWNPLQVLGMVRVNFHVGDQKVYSPWIVVVN